MKNMMLMLRQALFNFYQDFDVHKFFINQAYISSIVHNPAVLSLYSFDLAKSIIFTKHMPNGSLQTFLDNDFVKPNQDPCTGTNKYIILLGISFGMKYLHSQGILHLGLSPESVLLDEKYYPHISGFMKSVTNNNIPIKDLKVTCYLISRYEAGVTLLPPKSIYYQMVPEVSKLDDNDDYFYTYKSDVYSFALIAYQLLASKSIFDDVKHITYSIFIQKATKNYRPDLQLINNEEIKHFLDKMSSIDPAERPTFDEIVEELQKDIFVNYFNDDKTKVAEYLSLFNDKK